MRESEVKADVIVIGGGISGLMAANKLEMRGLSVTVLDKSTSVGGRLATRRIGPGLADHGAQFFTVREDAFQKWVDDWLRFGIIYEWSQGFSDGSAARFVPSLAEQDLHPRYATKGGMSQLAKYVAEPLKDVRLNIRVVTATGDEQGWVLQDEDGTLYQSRALLLTPPVPQSLEVLSQGATLLTEADLAVLKRIDYAPCLAGLFWVEGTVTVPHPGAVQRKNAPINWIADNRVKGISPEATLITVHANEQYSVQMWNAPDDRILSALETDMRIFLTPETRIREAQLKRWKYSFPLHTHSERYYVSEAAPLAVFAGDAFGGPRVEGAVLSGLAAADALLERLT